MPLGEAYTQYACQRLEALRSARTHFDNQWEEAAARVLPSDVNAFYSRGEANLNGGQGQKKTEKMFDATAAFAAQRFAAVMESIATPQGSMWHTLVPADKTLARNRAVREYYEKLNEILFAHRYRSNAGFVTNTQKVYLNLGVYGNGVLYIDAPDSGRGLRYRAVHIAETFFVENHAGLVDTLYRSFYLTAKQIMQKWGKTAPDAIQSAAANPMMRDKHFQVLHIVEPREDWNPRGIMPVDKSFRSCYIAVDGKAILEEGGYDDFPYGVSRYTQTNGEVYGRGPAQHVLPSIKLLNEEKKQVIKQGHRALDPVLLAHDDGNMGIFSLKNGAFNSGFVSADGRPLVHALPAGNIAVGDKLMEMERQIINDAFLITLFQILVETPQMTATEVLERAREKGMLLAPTAGRMQEEMWAPVIQRELNVLGAQPGVLPEMPTILLQGGPEALEYKVDYQSPLARMQRSEKAAGFMRALDTAANYAKMTGDVEPLDHFNFDAAMPEVLEIHGAPVSWTRTMEDVMKRRAGRQEAAQTEQMIQAAPAAAAVAKAIPQKPQG